MTIDQVRNHPLVQSLFHEDGSWWCHLVTGYWCPYMECGTIHETTIREVARLLRTAEPGRYGCCIQGQTGCHSGRTGNGGGDSTGRYRSLSRALRGSQDQPMNMQGVARWLTARPIE